MESRVKLLGHPVHPMLIVLPLGLLSAAVVFDLLYRLGVGVDEDAGLNARSSLERDGAVKVEA